MDIGQIGVVNNVVGGRSLRILVPLTRNNLFTLEDVSLLKLLGIEPQWVMETALLIWFSVLKPLPGQAVYSDDYGMICELVDGTFFQWDDSPEDHERQRLFAENADRFVDLIRKVHAAFYQYLRDLPEQVPSETYESLTLEGEFPEQDFSCLLLNTNLGY